MFTRHRQLAKPSTFPAGSARARARAQLALLGVALSVGALGCALEPREGDGFVADGREVQVSPTLIGNGRPDAGGVQKVQGCKQLALFKQYVMPLFTTKHDTMPEPQACVDCHDGTKQKAAIALFMDKLNDDTTCTVALALGATKADNMQAEILTSSDPSRPDVVHDFKFKTVDEYNRFRDGVLAWLNVEKPQ